MATRRGCLFCVKNMAQRQFASGDTSTWVEKFGDGSDGALTISGATTEAPIDSACAGTSGTTSLTATNASFATGQLILIHQTRGTGVSTWELNKISSYSAGTITTSYDLTNTYTNSGASVAQVRVLKQYSAVTVNTSQTWTSKAWNGTVGGILAYVCNGDTTITGNISANGVGFAGGAAGACNQTAHSGNYGEGTAAATGNSGNYAANGNGGGGGYVYTANNNGGGGAGGGNGATGTNGSVDGTANGGTGGAAVGAAALTTMSFGGGGGGGSWYYDTGTRPNGAGGSGGGIIFIISKTITVTGGLTVTGTAGASPAGAAGGGGAGGSVLFKGQIIALGTTLVTAAQGSGGTAGGGAAAHGGAGSVGRIHADYLTSISGTTTPALDSVLDQTLQTSAIKDISAKSNSKTTYYSGCNYDWTPSTGTGQNRGFSS